MIAVNIFLAPTSAFSTVVRPMRIVLQDKNRNGFLLGEVGLFGDKRAPFLSFVPYLCAELVYLQCKIRKDLIPFFGDFCIHIYIPYSVLVYIYGLNVGDFFFVEHFPFPHPFMIIMIVSD